MGGVEAARAEELHDYERFHVYDVVPISLAWETSGHAPIGVR